MAAAIVGNTKFNSKHIADGLESGFLDATALAEYLVRKGVPFREAHGIVGTLVAACETDKKKLSELGPEDFRKACGVIDEDVYLSLTAVNVAKAYASDGAAGAEQTRASIAYWKDRLKLQ
jgi:argininosuccinate lyase